MAVFQFMILFRPLLFLSLKFFVVFIFSIFFSCHGNAQDDSTNAFNKFLYKAINFGNKPKVDTCYILPYTRNFSIGGYTSYRFTILTHKINETNSVAYKSNNPVGLGLSVSYKNFSLSGSYAFNFLRNKEQGHSTGIDFQYHYYGRRFLLDLFFQNYKGFYTEDENKLPLLHPYMKFAQYGIYAQYIFNYKKFSYRAAFKQDEQQLKSAGSFQVGGGFDYTHIAADDSLLDGQSSLNNYKLSLTGGYVYTFVIKKNWQISAGASLGMDVDTENIQNIQKVAVSPSFFPRISLGYNASSWSFGVSAVMNLLYVSRNDQLNIQTNTGYTQMTYIKRLSVHPKFLGKIKYLN